MGWTDTNSGNRQTEASQSEADRQSGLFRSLLLSQQFIVQRLENLESNEPCGETPNEDASEGFVPTTPGLLGGNLSQTLNDTIFHDGMSASERRWTVRSDISGDQGLMVLNNLCQRFVHIEPTVTAVKEQPDIDVKSEPEAEPSAFGVTVSFKPFASHYHRYFEQEPTRELTTTIDIDFRETKSTVKDKVLAKLGIVYSASHYCLHHVSSSGDSHITLWQTYNYKRCRSRMKYQAGPVLSIQKTLWETCKDDLPLLQWWKPKIQSFRA